ncbi:MAG TPA: hypothetical protein VFP01_11315 [Propionibacteriaceae bacterium]|nr:hypothetical protein [Propionibacteriaceae bacterium]
MAYLTLRHRVMDPKRQDDITDALMKATGMIKEGEPTPTPPAYLVPWYPDGLRNRTLGPHSRKLVPITRYYPTLDPKVAVDFEPAPPEKWFHDEKLKFLCERHILYFPIALQDKLTEEQFISRYKDAKHLLERAQADLKEMATQQAAFPKDPLQWREQQLVDPLLQQAIQRLAILRAEADRGSDGRALGGAALRVRIGKHTAKLQEYCRGQFHNGLDAGKCAQLLADETQRLSDGQVHPSVAG